MRTEDDDWNFFGPPKPGEMTIFDLINKINEDRKDIFACWVAIPHEKEDGTVFYQLTLGGCDIEDKEQFLIENIVVTNHEEYDAYYEQYVKKEK